MAKPLVPSDLYRIGVALDPQLAPGGRAIVYRRVAFDRERDLAGGALWLVRPDAPAVPFTSGANDRLARIAPDGRTVAFVRDAEGQPRIHLIPLDGGEARPAGEPCARISSLAWSPDGTRLAYTAAANFDPASAHVYLDEPSGARHIRALPYKSDNDGLADGRRLHLFVLDLATGAVAQRTHGDFDANHVAWSPDGTLLAFTLGGEGEASMRSDVAVVGVDGGALRRITGSDGPHAAPAFAPDGRRIAWLGHRHGDDTRYASELYVAALDGMAMRSLTAALDRPAGNTIGGDLRSGGTVAPCWRTERELLSLLSDGPNASLYAFDVESEARTVIAGGEREIYGFSVSGHDVALAFSTPVVPSEIALIADGAERTLTDHHPWLRDCIVVAPQRLAARGADGTALDAWMMLPPNPARTPVPAVLEVHGGPHATYGSTFFLEFQILAGCGLAVVYGNPRGSAAYGQAFASAISSGWGGVDAEDVHAILDAALAAQPLDPQRVGVAGGSYGGLMTTWLLGHSQRFAAGVSMRAVNDYVSFTGATDIGRFLAAELGLDLSADGVRAMFERSPIRAAANISVPLLVMHSERDFRCPIDQGEQLFNVLRMLGKTDVEFVRFTADGHELSRGGKPGHRVLRLRAIARWLLRHLVGPRDRAREEPGSLFRPLEAESA